MFFPANRSFFLVAVTDAKVGGAVVVAAVGGVGVEVDVPGETAFGGGGVCVCELLFGVLFDVFFRFVKLAGPTLCLPLLFGFVGFFVLFPLFRFVVFFPLFSFVGFFGEFCLRGFFGVVFGVVFVFPFFVGVCAGVCVGVDITFCLCFPSRPASNHSPSSPSFRSSFAVLSVGCTLSTCGSALVFSRKISTNFDKR